MTWLPNQLMAVMDMMADVYVESGLEKMEEQGKCQKGLVEMMDNVKTQREKLHKEVKRWCLERGE